jgi:predicted DNA-binding transcriptional regulator YafY
MTGEMRALIDLVQKAIDACHVPRFGYEDRQGATTERKVHPLGLRFWGKVWTLVAWCEAREDFRMFRLDRASGLQGTDERFRPAPERSLAECLRRYERQFGPQS